MNTLQQEQLKLLNGLADDMPIEMNAGQLRALLATARAEGVAEERERIAKSLADKHISAHGDKLRAWNVLRDDLVEAIQKGNHAE